MTTTLIACSHGTSSPAGRAAISALVDQVRAIAPDNPVAEAFVDVQEPEVADVVAEAVARGDVVVVPLLLSGFHTKVDIARAVAAHPGRAVAAPPLGPHPLVTEVVAQRLAAAGVECGDAIVLAAAGSSDPAASLDVAATARGLAERLGRPVAVAAAAGGAHRRRGGAAARRGGRSGGRRELCAGAGLLRRCGRPLGRRRRDGAARARRAGGRARGGALSRGRADAPPVRAARR